MERLAATYKRPNTQRKQEIQEKQKRKQDKKLESSVEIMGPPKAGSESKKKLLSSSEEKSKTSSEKESGSERSSMSGKKYTDWVESSSKSVESFEFKSDAELESSDPAPSSERSSDDLVHADERRDLKGLKIMSEAESQMFDTMYQEGQVYLMNIATAALRSLRGKFGKKWQGCTFNEEKKEWEVDLESEHDAIPFFTDQELLNDEEVASDFLNGFFEKFVVEFCYNPNNLKKRQMPAKRYPRKKARFSE